MKSELKFDKRQLKKCLLQDYDLEVKRLIFVPKGEIGFHYIVECVNGKRYFLKMVPPSRQARPTKEKLGMALSLTHILHKQLEFENISYPIETNSGKLKSTFQNMPIALYPFIDRDNFYVNGCRDETLIKVARLIAKIHRSKDKISITVPKEDFTIDFEKDLIDGLDALEGFRKEGAYRQKLSELLLPIKGKLLKQLQELRRFRKLVQKTKKEFVLCHTDITPFNLMLDSKGVVYLIDWDDAALAPPEQDFIFFLGDHFKLFLEHYQAVSGKVKLHPALFAF